MMEASPPGDTPQLQGRVALVTGASRNIGAAIAERIALDGAAVGVNHPKPDTRSEAEEVVRRIRSAGGSAIALEADVSDETAVERMVETLAGELGPPDILVNNAAVYVARQVTWEDDTFEDWVFVMRVNVIGAFLCARAVVPHMKQRGRGDIISIASITPILGWTGNLPYVTSKAALIGFTRCLARELGAFGIRVNALAPGAISTLEQEAVFGPAEEIDARVFPHQSLKRRGVPGDVAGAVSLVLSPRAGFITGQCIPVDGGWAMP